MLDPRQHALFKHWKALCPAPGQPPPRSAFDPLDTPSALSTLVLAEVTGIELTFRVVGTDQVEAWGFDYTGRTLSQIMTGEYHDFIRGLYDQTIETRSCVFSHSRFQWDQGRTLDTRRLMMPLTATDAPDVVRFILASQVFDYGRTGPETPVVARGEAVGRIDLEHHVLKSE
ncbi:PAS domain-containing protein [Marivibrio halodurans]|uniref:PAS domain-containing protein n=1 Tax=Marivibrio halodurans TaxID=2039722 RepID=A0A8J7SJN5_9PROT|nr:PAS domain-containing protein [Marivibrio halodurans]